MGIEGARRPEIAGRSVFGQKDFNRGKSVEREYGDQQSGRLIERDAMGPSPVNTKKTSSEADVRRAKLFQQEAEAIASTYGRKGGWIPYAEAEHLLEKYTNTPEEPKNLFARVFMDEIQRRLKLRFKKDILPEKSVLFFSAIGTPMDRHHGRDALVYVKDPTTNVYHKLGIDVTLRESKLDDTETKAEVIMNGNLNPPGPRPMKSATDHQKKEWDLQMHRFKRQVEVVAKDVMDSLFGMEKNVIKPWVPKRKIMPEEIRGEASGLPEEAK